MHSYELEAIERNLDVPRGTLRHWLSESSLRHRPRDGATNTRDSGPRRRRTLRDLF